MKHCHLHCNQFFGVLVDLLEGDLQVELSCVLHQFHHWFKFGGSQIKCRRVKLAQIPAVNRCSVLHPTQGSEYTSDHRFSNEHSHSASLSVSPWRHLYQDILYGVQTHMHANAVTGQDGSIAKCIHLVVSMVNFCG